MLSLIKDELFSLKWFKNYLFIVLGSAIMASGYVFFIVPHKIVPGGVYGISIILHYLFNLPMGVMAFLLNIPLIFWGIKEIGPRFGAKTVLGIALTSVNIDVLSYFWGTQPLSQDILMSSVFGGGCIGAGLSLIFKAKATTGGSDIVANILFKRFRAPVGRTLIMIDFAVVSLGAIAFGDPNLVLYAIVTIFTVGRSVDAIMDGMNYKKAAFIISKKHTEIRETILKNLSRGGTVFSAKGMFKGDDRPVILTAVNRRELAILEEHVKSIDPGAFMIVFDSKEILGHGFTPLSDAS